MEDRYLYKAKRVDNGEWVQGYLFNDGFENGRVFVGGFVIEKYNGTACDEWTVTGINFYEIDPNTICQCTGLKDKNGKLIWENDVLMCHGNKKDLCKVCFGEFKVIDIENTVAVDIVQGWYYKPLETDGLSKCEPFCYEMPLTNYYIERMDAEVIGNIFDNAELLESEE